MLKIGIIDNYHYKYDTYTTKRIYINLESTKYSADFDLLNTFGPDTDPNNYSANQIFQSFAMGNKHTKDTGIFISIS